MACMLACWGWVSACQMDEEPQADVHVVENAGYYDTDAAYCGDLDENGIAYPTPRLRWSDVGALGPHPQVAPNNSPGYTTPDDASRYPSYKWLSANFTLDQSIQFLISVVTNVTSKLESVQSTLDSDTLATDLADMGVGAMAGTMVEQTSGLCFCVDSCDMTTIQDQVQGVFDDIATNLGIDALIQNVLDNALDGVVNDLDQELQTVVQYLQGPDIKTDLTNQIINAVEATLTTQLGTSCDGVINANLTAQDIDASVALIVNAVEASIQNLIDAWLILKNQVYPQVKTSYLELRDILASIDADGIQGLLKLDWNALITQFKALGDDWKPIVQDIKNLVDAAKANIETIQTQVAFIRTTLDDWATQMVGNTSTTGQQSCVNALAALAGPGGSSALDIFAANINGSLTPWWNLHFVTPFTDLGADLFGSLGQIASYETVLNDAVAQITAGDSMACFQVGTRTSCKDHCDPGANIWVPEDFLQDPKAGLTLASGTGLFILEQTGFLDTANKWLKDATFLDAIMSGIGAVIDIANKIKAVLIAIADILEEVEIYVDRFTEGYHIGAYNDVRPDLHMCIGYAGHGAYAQFGNAGNNTFSIGSRYASQNLSASMRAQNHRSGIAVSAYGHELALAPSLEFQLGIDGWKMWNLQKPFGLPLSLNINQELFDKYDVFNVAPDDGGLGGTFANNPGATVPVAAFVIKGMFPVRQNPANVGSTPLWPRPAVTQPWEQVSAAVISAGLNLGFSFPKAEDPPFTKELVAIPVYGPLPQVTIIPSLSFRFGVAWMHETNHLRDYVQDAINANLPAAQHLTAADFARDMHAFQAPDVTQDLGNSVFVEPGVKVAVEVGFHWKVIRIGIGFGIGYSLNIEPSGKGGVADLNAALANALLHSNPPEDAVCEPVWEHTKEFGCNNAHYQSDAELSCQPDDDGRDTPSCCLIIRVEKRAYRACIGEMTVGSFRLDQEMCKNMHVSGHIKEVTEILNGLLGSAPKFLKNAITSVLALATDVEAFIDIESSWSTQSCQTRKARGTLCEPSKGEIDGDIGIVDIIPIIGDGQPSTASSECEQLGACINIETGAIHTNDVPENACKDNERFEKYHCRGSLDSEVTGWTGPGCHPLQNGFASACGCESDAQCANGETCNAGSCLSAPATCECGDNDACPSGRICRSGACAMVCQSDSQCAGDLVCNAGACAPPHGIPFAEEITWGMRNVEAPAHVINSYAYSDILITNLLHLYFEISAALNLGFIKKEFKLLDLHKAIDLGSKRKAWYQVGLEAFYQTECADPTMAWDVTNRYPQSTTAPHSSLMGDSNECGALGMQGGVCRYCDPRPAAMSNQTDYPYGNCGDVDTFIRWCKEEMPQHKENPRASSPDDIASSISDTYNFAQDVGTSGWNASSICIDGVPWNDWIMEIGPTYDSQGNITGGGFGDLHCKYTDPATQTEITFPCASMATALLDFWGCSSVNNVTGMLPGSVLIPSAYHAGSMAANLEVLYATPATFDPVNGWETALSFDVSSIPTHLLSYETFVFTSLLQQCVESHAITEVPCECSADADCGDLGRCTGGICEELRVTDEQGHCYASDCSPRWAASVCSPISLGTIDVGACCGDGIVQQTTGYYEACDPTAPGGPPCKDDCTFATDDGGGTGNDREGSCCMEGGCYNGFTAEKCQDNNGSFAVGVTCDARTDCEQVSTGSCCMDGRCTNDVPADKCRAGGGSFAAGKTCEERTDCESAVTGSCCMQGTCYDGLDAEKCNANAGSFAAGVMCAQRTDCGNRGSCCSSSGCFDNYPAERCEVSGGSYEANMTCAQRNECKEEPSSERACCIKGMCSVMLPELCQAQGGKPSTSATCTRRTCLTAVPGTVEVAKPRKGCSASQSGTGGSYAWLAVGVGLLALRRRRD